MVVNLALSKCLCEETFSSLWCLLCCHGDIHGCHGDILRRGDYAAVAVVMLDCVAVVKVFVFVMV